MTIWIKQGVCGTLVPQAQKGYGRVARLYASRGYDLYVTSIRDGNHTEGSFHYIGRAFDIRAVEEISVTAIKTALGKGWDVIYHAASNHIHCEYDPK